MTIEHLFTTPIKIIEMENYERINDLLFKSMFLKFKNNFSDNLPEEEKKQAEGLFINEAEKYVKESIDRNFKLYFYSSWTVCKQKYAYDSPHHHGDNNVIGVYYIKAEENCGDLLLHDPRGTVNFLDNREKNTEGYLVTGRCYHRIKPKTGNFVLFPSYIVHSVEPNMNDETRIALAINFRYEHLR